MDNQALKPDFFMNIPSFVAPEGEIAKGATEEEIALSPMYDKPSWKVFKQYTERVLSELDDINEMAISNGKSREEIGENAIIISLVKGIVRQIINKVENANKSCNGK